MRLISNSNIVVCLVNGTRWVAAPLNAAPIPIPPGPLPPGLPTITITPHRFLGPPISLPIFSITVPGPGGPNISGTWFFRGIQSQPAHITQTWDRIEAVTEKGVRGSGSFLSATTIVVDFPFARGLRGTITGDGNRIDWADGEFWTR